MRYLLFVVLIFLILPLFRSFAQEEGYYLNQAEILFQKGKYEDSKKNLIKAFVKDKKDIEFYLFMGKIYARQFQMDSSMYWLDKVEASSHSEVSTSQKFQYNLWRGFNYEINKNYYKALKEYFLSEGKLKSITDPYYTGILHQRLVLINSEKKYEAEKWINRYTKEKNSLNNDSYSNSYHNALGKHYHYRKKPILAYKEFEKSINYSKRLKDSVILNNSYFHKGIIYAEHFKLQDSARHYYRLAKDFCNCPENKLFQTTNRFNECRTYLYENKWQIAKKCYLKTLKDTTPSRMLHIRNNTTRDLYLIYKFENRIDSAFYYLEHHKFYDDSLKKTEQKKAMNELRTRYEVAENEKEIVQLLNKNLKSEANRIRNKNIMIGSLSLLILGSVIGFLIYKSTKRKQHIAEQQQEIEVQKTEKLLKEQELTAIDAMISGQEKERQRLANDLHDNLGGTLATVRLHFQHLKNNRENTKIENIEELYSKTDNLLEEAYQKVRTIAHEKNSGVMANQGLLLAIKNLAKKVSNGKTLQIEVQDYGLEERLDNMLEISIFRMIQELITNTIKHANASEIHISLTNHDSLLNIIVEDNGEGFDAKILPEKDGMGLATIEKRVEHLEGTFEIDSTIGKGTNIIINIPI